RTYIVLGIETSCDDTSVCLYDRRKGSLRPELLASLKIRADNSVDGGIVPTKALSHHQANLGILVQHLLSWRYPVIPDLICVTRGPGMRGSLAAGTEFAKGLAVALNIPIIGVHHMLGHLLSARMVYSRRKSHGVGIANFPYVTMLVSGGHTMLVLSRSLTDHEILADTVDIAIGDAIEKCARFIGLEMRQQNSYGPSLEQPETPPEELKSLSLNVAMRNKGTRTGSCAFSFAGYLPMVERSVQEVFGGNLDGISELQRAKIAYEIQQAMFTQIIERVKYVLDTKLDDEMKAKVKDIVLAGGVASNQELRHMFRTQLQTYSPYPNTDATKPDDTETGPGIPKYNIFSPPPALCTDNSEMIAWAGIELWESQKLRSELSMEPLPEWPLENFTTNVDGWTTE
ncbi:glycoprotease family-domain-containing protein, partial [Myxozyma melibiosi]